jgi:LmbE family N-acetylglucosaminyl deacetylase
MKKTIVVFAPHPDDETLACGGTIALNRQHSNNVYVVFMTDGRNSHFSDFGITTDPTPDELRDIRYDEARRATGILDVKNEDLIFLDFEDGTLEANLRAAKTKVEEILKRLKPDEVFFPSAEDKHSDHQATNTVVGESLRAVWPAASVHQYIVWSDQKRPFRGRQSVTVDVSNVLALKKRAINQYQSQITIFSNNQPKPVLSKTFLQKFMKPVEIFTGT